MRKRTLIVAALATTIFASCLKNDGGISTPRAGILFDLLSPDAKYTTIALNGDTIGLNVSYGSGPSIYNQVTSGTGHLSVYSISFAQLLNSNFNIELGKYYSMFIVDSASKMKNIIVMDSVNSPGTTDSVKVRFYNFTPNSPLLNVGVKDSSIIWAQRPFETQGTANANNTFIPMKAGAYTFQIFTTYSGNSLKDTTITFSGGHVFTLFTKGFFADTTGSTALGLGVVQHG
jgi:hypothetical protein